MKYRIWLPVMLLLVWMATPVLAQSLTVTDMAGRSVRVPAEPDRIVCLGPGALRLIVYLDAQDRVAGVEAMEKRFAAGRPYWLAQPQLHTLPVVGPGGPGAINKKPDMEAVLRIGPDLIFATYMDAPLADEVAATLGIPVVVLSYGELSRFDRAVYHSLELAGRILNRQRRADEVVKYIEDLRAELKRRTADTHDGEKPGVFVGGIGYRGAHGITSTQRNYIPLDWNHAVNLAGRVDAAIGSHVFVDREVLLGLDPEVIFIDGAGRDLVAEDYRKRPDFYRALSAFRSRKVYRLLPFNFYTTNIGTAMADALAIGKTLYPSRFADVDPAERADAIYAFLVGRPVYDQMAADYGPVGEPVRFLQP
ncbi:iron ABC transporter substrate-binding protein [Desulfosarcina alkanivorans]|jgi:iron complex transport system substrate-binding protein|uniref:Iron ABC transporter substrate-binding protein n=1 Tax=Desulfosarcina alkanivorans TaxID=571177 RepID=A0A5K7YL07_9BACT|nr:iron ABC transporter substrate-binding protein [Desulfosarcina alkanivorans]BBO68569.1 iron ABC transporter substrate-binding protein [Desulfosarcina alkanivorans]